MKMEKVEWTKEQRAVIDLRGKNILVSAAAGSGKTAVLVERIINRVVRDDNPTDIDRLLVVTFTKAAAAEMRGRIRAELAKEAAARPGDIHLIKQLSYIHNADIMTIDSFCNMILRENFNAADIDPSYRIGDENELALIKSDVIKDILEERYRDGDGRFFDFVEMNAPGRDDSILEKLILTIYDYACSHVNPDAWLDKCAENYVFDTGIEEVAWFKETIRHIDDTLEDCAHMAEKALGIIEEYGLLKYFEIFSDEYRQFMAAMEEKDIDKKFGAVRSMIFERLPSILKKDMCDEEAKTIVQGLRKRYKDAAAGLKEKFCAKSVGRIEKEIRAMAGSIKIMTDITREFASRYFEHKTEKNILDFNDIIHLVIGILKNDDMTPSALAAELSEKYDEIMIDEYQDSNYLQDELLSAVSKESSGIHNMFMVGDVKQSIYKFRLAQPEIFLHKYGAFKDFSEEADNVRINLSSNFRSRREVIDSVNFVFEQIMGASFGGIEYDANQRLRPGSEYPYPSGFGNDEINPYDTEIMIIDSDGDSDGREREAAAVAIRINEIVNVEKLQIYDKKTGSFRCAGYGDVAVLMRGAKINAPVYGRVFESYGIPSYSEITTGFFDTFEIKNPIALLRIIDNPLQDIPMGAVLRNIFGFTTEDMAVIRMGRKNMSMYASLLQFLDDGEERAADFKETYKKAALFGDALTRYRKRVPYMKLRDLINYVLKDTGFEDYVTAMPAGEKRAANIKLLKDKAESYEKTSYSGLFNFVRYIERVKSSDTDMGEAAVTEDAAAKEAVSIMTIHKSKGLEFPIVILADTCRGFNKSDARARVIMHRELGIASDYINIEKRTKSRSIFKSYMAAMTERDNLAEELRILYVAMTRAREKLIITGCKNADALMKKAVESTNGTDGKYIGSRIIGKASCYMDWILCAHAGTDFCGVNVINGEDITYAAIRDAVGGVITKEKLLSMASREDEDLFSYVYPYIHETKIFSKYSVSDIKKMNQEEPDADDDVKNLYEYGTADIYADGYIPEFILRSREETGSDTGKVLRGGTSRGNAYHGFFEIIDYERGGSLREIKEQLAECVRNGRMDENTASMIDAEKVLKFVESPIGKRMTAAYKRGELRREKQYIMSVPAEKIVHDYPGEEKVLIQGIIDAFFEEDGDIVIVDYKTDNVRKPEDLETLYRSQIEYYALAVEGATGKRVSEKIIYSIKFDMEILLQ